MDRSEPVVFQPAEPERWAAELIRALIEIGQPAIDYYVRRLEQRDPSAHVQAREILPLFGERAVESVVTLVDHPSAEVRLEAVQVLARIGGPAALDSLIQCLHDPDERVAPVAVDGLLTCHDQAMEALQKAAASTNDQAAADRLRKAHAVIYYRVTGVRTETQEGTQLQVETEDLTWKYDIEEDRDLSTKTAPPAGPGLPNVVESLRSLPGLHFRRKETTHPQSGQEMGLKDELLNEKDAAGFPGHDDYAINAHPIFPQLASDNRQTRDRAIQEAIDLGRPIAGPLVQAMRNSSNKTFILSGLTVLRSLCDKNCVKELRGLLDQTRDQEIKQKIEYTIQTITGRRRI